VFVPQAVQVLIHGLEKIPVHGIELVRQTVDRQIDLFALGVRTDAKARRLFPDRERTGQPGAGQPVPGILLFGSAGHCPIAQQIVQCRKQGTHGRGIGPQFAWCCDPPAVLFTPGRTGFALEHDSLASAWLYREPFDQLLSEVPKYPILPALPLGGGHCLPLDEKDEGQQRHRYGENDEHSPVLHRFSSYA
jgi:hypothetical protein